MSIQSTREISRERAEELWVERQLLNKRDRLTRLAKTLNDNELEEELEEEFYNYWIVREQ